MCGSYLYCKILLLKTRKKSKYLCVSSIPRKKTRKYWQSYSNHIPTKASGILAFSPVTAAKSQMLIHIQTGFLPPKRLQMIFSLFEFHIIISHMDECPTCGNTGTRFAGTYCFLCLKQQQKPTTPGHLEFKINLVHIWMQMEPALFGKECTLAWMVLDRLDQLLVVGCFVFNCMLPFYASSSQKQNLKIAPFKICMLLIIP